MAISVVDGLLSLGVITREQLAAASAVDDRDASTILGKLVAVGVDPGAIFPTASALAKIPLASPALLQSAYVVDGIPAESVPHLRAALVLPVRRDTNGVVDVVVAAPEAAHGLVSLGIPQSTAYLAEERVLRSLVDAVLPLPRAANAFGGSLELELARPPPAASASDFGPAAGGDAWPAAQPSTSSLGDYGRPATQAEVARQQAREKAEAAAHAAREKAEVAAHIAKEKAGAAFTALKERGAPAAKAAFEKGLEGGGVVAGMVREKVRGRERTVAAAGAGVLLFLIALLVVKCSLGGVDATAQKQQAAFAEAQDKENQGEIAWAIAGYSRVVDLAPDSPLALEALYARARVEKHDGDIGNAGRDLDLVIKNPKSDPGLIERARELKKQLVVP